MGVAIDQGDWKLICPLCLGTSRPEIPGEPDRRVRVGVAFLCVDLHSSEMWPDATGHSSIKKQLPPLEGSHQREARRQVLILTLPDWRGDSKAFSRGPRLLCRKRSTIPTMKSFNCLNNS